MISDHGTDARHTLPTEQEQRQEAQHSADLIGWIALYLCALVIAGLTAYGLWAACRR